MGGFECDWRNSWPSLVTNNCFLNGEGMNRWVDGWITESMQGLYMAKQMLVDSESEEQRYSAPSLLGPEDLPTVFSPQGPGYITRGALCSKVLLRQYCFQD